MDLYNYCSQLRPLTYCQSKKNGFINKSILSLHDLLVDFGFMCRTLIHLCTTSSIQSFRPVWFVAQSKITWQHCPRNHYFHIIFLNCLFVFEDMWRGALLWGNFVFRFPLTSLKISISWMEIPSPVLKIIQFSSKVLGSTLL